MQGETSGDSIRMSHDAIDMEAHVVLRVGVGDAARILHDGAQVGSANEAIIAGGVAPVDAHRERSRDLEKIGALEYGNTSFDRANEGARRATKFPNGEVVRTLIIAKADVHFVGEVEKLASIRAR